MPPILVEPYVYSGARNAVIYALNTYGRPAASGLSAYVGLEVYGLKGFALTIPPARRITHIGNDRALKSQTFPPIEAASGEVAVGATDLEILSVLMGTTVIDKAGIRLLPHLSDKQGYEPNVGILIYQASVSKSGAQRWRVNIISSCKAIPRIPGAGQESIDIVFDLTPDPTDAYLWGSDTFTLADPSDPYSQLTESGAIDAGIWDGFCAFRPRIASFAAQAAQVLFEFPDHLQAANATDILVVTANGTGTPVEEDPADYTATTAGVTFDTAPVTTYGAGTEVHILYQIED